MASTRGRQVVVPLTNMSGGGVIAGDVVVIDTANNDAFTTTTTGAATIVIGIAQETIAAAATGRVLLSGYAALVNVNASVTRGHYGKTHTVAKQATGAGASRVVGAFCQFLTGGTTPDAILFGWPDAASSSATQGTPGLTLGTTNVAGSAGAYVGTDATIAAFDATVPVTQAFGDAAAAGAAGVAARRDHKHGMPGGAWTTYTPTWTTSGTAPSLGNGTLIGRYKLLDANTLIVHIVFTMGSTTTVGTGAWSFALPQATVARNQIMTAWILDAGTDNKLAVANVNASSSKVDQITIEAGNTVTELTPQTWAVSDQLTIEGILEV